MARIPFLRSVAILAAMASLAGCVTSRPDYPIQETVQAADKRVVILVGIDGFRADYLDRGITPNLTRLATEGGRAQKMIPAFPSVTFPNFYTLATGLHPDRHGVIYNTMEDPALPGRTFSLGNRAEATDPVWWNQAEPIWVTAKRQGHRVATMFWPGSEAAIRGIRPDYWLPFDQGVPNLSRVNILLGWMSLPPAERPDFATLYFDVVDSAGHRAGPDSAQVNQAIADVDAAIGKLVEGLTARGIKADLVIVSDHGMAATSPDRVIFLDDLVDVSSLKATATGPIALMSVVGPKAAVSETSLLGKHDHFECWRKSDVPARLDFGHNARVPPIVCAAQSGWLFATKASYNPAYASGGAHGYDNQAPDMAALFLVWGPDFKAGSRLDHLDNVDVYPRLVQLLGIVGLENQGSLSATASVMVR
jgi:predicted AlkP superfamily pyrophosphatase or phosphodiesterase